MKLMSILTKLKKYIHSLLDYLEEHLHVLIIALAVLVGLLGGAKIISNGIVDANRFQFVGGEENPSFFDTKTGAVCKYYHNYYWYTNFDSDHRTDSEREIESVEDWVNYLRWADEALKDAR
jgi:hypothetical protein